MAPYLYLMSYYYSSGIHFIQQLRRINDSRNTISVCLLCVVIFSTRGSSDMHGYVLPAKLPVPAAPEPLNLNSSKAAKSSTFLTAESIYFNGNNYVEVSSSSLFFSLFSVLSPSYSLSFRSSSLSLRTIC